MVNAAVYNAKKYGVKPAPYIGTTTGEQKPKDYAGSSPAPCTRSLVLVSRTGFYHMPLIFSKFFERL